MVGKGAVAGMALFLAASAQAQQAEIGIKPVELTEPSYTFDTAEQHGIRVSVLARLSARPFASCVRRRRSRRARWPRVWVQVSRR